ncbi:heterokaryon incompatibility protein [Colletotrichum orchidophilum]|uniref:Heterokaryon incompatibility protein n=1 Tax=Colletotrichum orchidophilum TaxID=1209926 RepID=A0A1G4BGJ6_9PEZI|nr:heterokaryon incompatibility protein [Colletotrichum orchidophilum]OHF00433.1 heterokaryon incompatibility protein [Colletotrichum orchidophilum]
MWLLNTTTYELRMFIDGTDMPPYAILSHTWGPDEVTFQDIQNLPLASTKAGFTKIQGCCTQALRHNIDWAWIDSCCIDKTSSAELSEAINSMYSYYLLSRVCFVYLGDVPPLSYSLPPMGRLPSLASSRWFTRGWTLQELIAPRRTIFYTSDWSRLGTKGVHTDERPFIQDLSSITGIFESVLAKTRHPRDYSVAERMSWAANRQTTRAEDQAYCLMGLFGVNIPVLYGEGLKHAFQRLQHEIIRTSPDETIFAWRADPQQVVVDPYTRERRSRSVTSGLLADSPADFARSHDIHQRALLPPSPFREFSMTNMGLSIAASLVRLTPAVSGSLHGSLAPQSMFVLPIGASGRPNETSPRTRVGLYLEPVVVAASRALGHKTLYYRRAKCNDFCFAATREFPQGELADIYILEDDQFAEMQFADRPPTPRPGSGSGWGSGSDAGGNWSPSMGARLSLSPSPSPRPSPRASPMPRMDLG